MVLPALLIGLVRANLVPNRSNLENWAWMRQFVALRGRWMAFFDLAGTIFRTPGIRALYGRLSTVDIAAKAKGYTVLIECWK